MPVFRTFPGHVNYAEEEEEETLVLSTFFSESQAEILKLASDSLDVSPTIEKLVKTHLQLNLVVI